MKGETDLILSLCRSPLSSEGELRARSLLRSAADWDFFFSTAARWEVEQTVFANFERVADEIVPQAAREKGAERLRNARAFALARTLMLISLVKRLEAAGVAVLVLKGPAVGVIAYGDPSMRSFRDADLLVRKVDLTHARDVLIEMNFMRDYDPASESVLVRGGHALEFSSGSARVELHSTLLERHLRFSLSESAVWAGAVEIRCAGAHLRTLGPAHQLLFLCAHGAKHRWERLRWICDVAQLVDRSSEADAVAAVATAREIHATRILGLGLRLARELFSIDTARFPISVKDEAAITPLVGQTLHTLGIGSAPHPGAPAWTSRMGLAAAALIYWSKTRERVRDRIACMATVFFVPTEKDRSMGYLAFIARPVRLTVRLLRRVPSP